MSAFPSGADVENAKQLLWNGNVRSCLNSRNSSRRNLGPFRVITGSQLISHFVGAFFLAQASRLYKQEAREVLV